MGLNIDTSEIELKNVVKEPNYNIYSKDITVDIIIIRFLNNIYFFWIQVSLL